MDTAWCRLYIDGMYRDKTLIPTEAIRLAALGVLTDGPQRYAELAASVRHFASAVMGPSLDILGTSIELLRLEGLVEPIEGTGLADNALLRVTPAGEAELKILLKSRVRSPVDDLNKLVTALKMRFFHLLGAEEKREQLDLLIEATESEMRRLADLRARQPSGLLSDWLGHELVQLAARKRWFEARMSEQMLSAGHEDLGPGDIAEVGRA
jgi:hypothetical protein